MLQHRDRSRSALVALVATICARAVRAHQTFTLPAERGGLAIFFFRFFAIQIVFYGAAAIFTGILNSHRHFVAPAAGPIFNNLVVIVTMLGFYVPFQRVGPDSSRIVVLAVGTTLGVSSRRGRLSIPSALKMRWR